MFCGPKLNKKTKTLKQQIETLKLVDMACHGVYGQQQNKTTTTTVIVYFITKNGSFNNNQD